MRPTLRRARQFADVYTRGRKFVSPAFVLFHLAAPEARVAFVASRKVGGAVQRNRAKRVLRAALTQAEAEASGATPGWLILVARRDILAQSSRDVAGDLRAHLAAIAPRTDASHDGKPWPAPGIDP
jgi:ribonuclease P protein component